MALAPGLFFTTNYYKVTYKPIRDLAMFSRHLIQQRDAALQARFDPLKNLTCNLACLALYFWALLSIGLQPTHAQDHSATIELAVAGSPMNQNIKTTRKPPRSPAPAAEDPNQPQQATSTGSPQIKNSHARMLDALNGIRRRSPNEHGWIGDGRARKLRSVAATIDPSTPLIKQRQVYYGLGMTELMLGNESAAIAALTRCHLLDNQAESSIPTSAKAQLTFELAVAYLRYGETQNCCQRNNPDSCIVPIQGEGIHVKPEGSTEAIKYFLKALDSTDRRSPIHLKARWLLNIAYMTIGEYPANVPEQYLIKPGTWESGGQVPRFRNIAKQVGVDTFSNCGGAIADDFNNDGYLDLAVSNYHPEGQLQLLINNQDGGFQNTTTQADLSGIYGGLNLVQADYNNDGYTDILVLRGGWLFAFGNQPNSLLRNNGNGTFTDVTFDAGLGDAFYPTQTAAWADFDNDGDLDLYIGNETTSMAKRKVEAPCQLFRNNADGTFTDIAQHAGVTNNRFTKAVVWGDYDADRLPDIYVSNFNEANRLYHNNGDGTFTDVAPQLNVTGPNISFPAWFWDFDNDGHLDLYASGFNSNATIVAADYLGVYDNTRQISRLYQGDGQTFRDVAQEFDLTRSHSPMGANFGDLDNDGYLDFYLGTGDVYFSEIAPNAMYLNRNGQRFEEVTMAGGFGHLQKGHAIVFADFDNDGDQDVFEQMGGALLGDKFYDALFMNPGFGNHWISVKLIGVQSNRSGIGARIRVVLQDQGTTRSIYKHVDSGGSFGANPLRQTIGLGQTDRIDRLEVFWPTTNRTQVFEDLPVDQTIQIIEGADMFTSIPLRTFQLGQPRKP